MVDVLIRHRERTADAERAAATLRAVLGSGEVAAEGRLDWDQRSLIDDGVTVSRITASADAVRAEVPRSADLVVVAVRRGTVALVGDGRRDVLTDGALGVVLIGDSVGLEWSSATVDLFSFPLSSVARLLQAGADLELHAPRRTPRSAGLALHWLRLAGLLVDEVLDDVDLYTRDLLRGHTIDALVAATIEAFDIADGSEVDVDRDAAVIRRAAGFMQDRLGDPIAIADAARAAGVSVRGLQLVFQRRLDETPLAHLRRLRLHAARHALLVAAPGTTTVGAVARRCGYTNQGRFGTHYRDLFDESPATTLRRADAR